MRAFALLVLLASLCAVRPALPQTAPAPPSVAASGLGDRTVASSQNREASERVRDDLAGKLARREIQRAPSSIPGREIVQVLTEIPAGIESGWHVHAGEEVGYIIAGEVEMMVQGRANVILRAGDGFLIP